MLNFQETRAFFAIANQASQANQADPANQAGQANPVRPANQASQVK